jgi:hypothetical protein
MAENFADTGQPSFFFYLGEGEYFRDIFFHPVSSKFFSLTVYIEVIGMMVQT